MDRHDSMTDTKHNNKSDPKRTHRLGTVSKKYRRCRNDMIQGFDQIFALDSAVVKRKRMFSSHGGFIIYAMYHHCETIK